MRVRTSEKNSARERQKKTTQSKPCNLCGQQYRRASRFARFCDSCKQSSDLYRLCEWLPSTGGQSLKLAWV